MIILKSKLLNKKSIPPACEYCSRGSCAPDGTLAFSWRLVMAPDWVLDYVVAHEVAHLRELNHSPRFWAHVARLTPHRDAAVEWLRLNGPALLRVG